MKIITSRDTVFSKNKQDFDFEKNRSNSRRNTEIDKEKVENEAGDMQQIHENTDIFEKYKDENNISEIEENEEKVSTIINRRQSINLKKSIRFGIYDYIYLTYEEARNGPYKINWIKAINE